jgi:hypothetical protein
MRCARWRSGFGNRSRSRSRNPSSSAKRFGRSRPRTISRIPTFTSIFGKERRRDRLHQHDQADHVVPERPSGPEHLHQLSAVQADSCGRPRRASRLDICRPRSLQPVENAAASALRAGNGASPSTTLKRMSGSCGGELPLPGSAQTFFLIRDLLQQKFVLVDNVAFRL